MSKKKQPDILCIASVPWDYLKIAPQQTMKEMTQHARILYVERPFSCAGLLVEPRKTFGELRKAFQPPREVMPNLHVVTPMLAPPFRTRSAWANRLEMEFIRRSATAALQQLDMHPDIIWAYLPNSGVLRNVFGEQCFVYDVADEFSAFPNVNTALCKRMEADTVRNANLVFAISENLVQERIPLNPNTQWVPIGAEAKMFLEADLSAPAPEIFERLPRPIAGYYGSIDTRMDIQLCRAVAEALPDISFIFFGPVRDEALVQPLRALTNVHFPGSLPYESLPQHACRFDICLLPYAMTRFNQYIFPNKIFEYLATGKPVVTTPIPAITYLAKDHLIRIADTAETFATSIQESLAEKGRYADARKRCAAENTWRHRADTLWNHVTTFLNEKSEA